MADSSFNIDDFTRKLAEQINYRQRKTRDGSHMTPEGVRQSIQEAFKEIEDKRKSDVEGIENEYNQTLSNTQRAIDEIGRKIAELQERNEHASNSSGGDINISYNQNVTNNNQGQSSVGVQASQETLRELVEQRRQFAEELSRLIQEKTAKINDINNKAERQKDATEYKIKSDARSDAYSAVSGGKSDWFKQKADTISSFGNGLSNLAGGKGALGKFGGAIGKAGGLLSKFAGPIGIAIKGMELFAQAANSIAEGLAKTGEFINKEQQYQFERNQRIIELNNAQFIEDMGKVAVVRMAEMDRDGTYQVAQAKIRNMEYVGAAETQVGAITEGINNAAWSAAYKRLDIETQRQTVENEQKQRNLAATYAIREREGQNMAVHAQTVAGQNSAIVDYINNSERNAMARQHWIQNNPLTANAIGEDNNLGLGVQQLRPSVEGIRMLFGDKKDNAIDAAGTKFMRDTEMGASIKNPLTGENYELGRNFEQSAISRMYGSQGAIQRTLGNMFGLNKVGQTVDNQQMATRQWEREELAKTFELDAKLRYEAYNEQLKDIHAVHNKQMEYVTEVRNENIKTAAEVKKNWMKLAQATEQWTDKFDKTIRETIIRNGFGGSEEQMRGYEKGMMNIYGDLARRFNVDIDEVMQVQSAYSASTGRNYFLGGEDYEKSVAMGKYAGDIGIGAAIGAQMEIFNTSVSDAANLTLEAVKNVEKLGLNGQKYMKDLLKNLKQAEKYHFKGGAKGLMDMAKWAQQTRFNMDSLPNILEKIQGGGLESNITTAAKLQVLGGKFAMGSNPLAMIYEGFNDPEALTSRYNDMISDTGHWNKETGDVDFLMGDQIRLRQFAEATGQSLEDIKNQQRQRIKGERMGNLLDKFKDDDQKSMVTNKAFYDKNTNSWKVKLLNQKGEIKDKAVADLTAEDLKFLNPQDHEEKIEHNWERLLSWIDRMEGEQKGEQANLARQTLDNTLNAYQERLNIAANEFTKKQAEYAKTVMDLTNKTTQEFQGFMEALVNEDKTKSLAKANEKAVIEATAVVDTISQIKKKFLEARGILDDMIRRTQEEHENGNKDDEMKGDNMSQRSTTEVVADAILGNNFSLNTWKSRGEMAKRAWNKVSSWFDDGVTSAAGTPMAVAASSVTPIHDGTVSMASANDSTIKPAGVPLAVPASSVTPIHDGTTIAKTDPQDHAIFAKVGGPFDKLFNGVFGRIDEIYESLLSPQSTSSASVSTRVMNMADIVREYQMSKNIDIYNDPSVLMYESMANTPQTVSPLPLPQVMPMQIESGQSYSANVTLPNSNTHIDFSNINVNHTGELRLTAPNGQSIDILKELQNNPAFVRDLTKYISEGISRQINGGRGISNGGRMVSF